MPTIDCPAPDCQTSWADTTAPEVLFSLINLHARTAHPTDPEPAPTPSCAAKVEKVRRPTVSAAGTSEDWSYFELRWSEYKADTYLKGTDTVYQLLECCDEGLRKDLTRTFGALTLKDERTILTNIKSLAVRQENIMVARVQLQQMRQDRDEPVRAFAARLRGQAGVCNYTTDCTCTLVVDFSDIMVRDALIRGLEDDDIRLDILGQSQQDMRLDEVLQYVEAKESGKRSASRLLEGGATTTAAAAASSYKRREKNRVQPHDNRSQSCDYCGKTGHDRNKQERMRKCTAYNHTCAKCGLLHHPVRVCAVSQSGSNSPHRPMHRGHTMMPPLSSKPCALSVTPHPWTLMQSH